jgi:UDP-glucose 4-epimerase
MKDKIIVVTGGAGFIGSNLAEALMEENDVIVIDDISTGIYGNIRSWAEQNRIRFVKGSICDPILLKGTFRDVEYVFHNAAIPSVQRSVKDPIRTNEAGITGTLNILIAARDSGVKKVVFASSSSVYGETPTLPKHEGMVSTPLSPYSLTKLAGEHYCRLFTELYDLKTVSLRYFNVYGPRQNPDSEYSAAIPCFIKNALEGKPLVIYGDGEQTRDFTFVKDVVRANVLAAESNATGVFNIATGRRISINDLAKLILKISGRTSSIVYAPPRHGDVRHSLADISRAHESFGYSPQYSLEDGLLETISWFSRNYCMTEKMER